MTTRAARRRRAYARLVGVTPARRLAPRIPTTSADVSRLASPGEGATRSVPRAVRGKWVSLNLSGSHSPPLAASRSRQRARRLAHRPARTANCLFSEYPAPWGGDRLFLL